jgi:hypothetical protein
MKIAKQAPAIGKTAVYVADDKYELFIIKPVSLGFITKQGNYWETEDGVRFLNNRDAINYLSTKGTSTSDPATSKSPAASRLDRPASQEASDQGVSAAYTKPASKLKTKTIAKAKATQPQSDEIVKLYNQLGLMLRERKRKHADIRLPVQDVQSKD